MRFEAKVLNANSVEVSIGDSTVLFSYETPVAARVNGLGWVRSEDSHSKTTAKHIGQWSDHYHRRLPQDWFDRLPALLSKRAAAEVLADDLRDLTSCLMEQEFRTSRAGRYAEELASRIKSWEELDVPPEEETIMVGRRKYEHRHWRGLHEFRRPGVNYWQTAENYMDYENSARNEEFRAALLTWIENASEEG